MQKNEFLGGVVEGFYGQPWTEPQRLRLFDQMADWGLNTYFYAPKDDLKHRALWRECYDAAELRSLRVLIDACNERGLAFIYGLSPGLDIGFSDPAELDRIQARFSQLLEVGVQHFALLFDDLPDELTAADRQAFDSVAAAQCAVTNAAVDWARQQAPDGRFLFCPAPYCDRMDRSQLGGAGYLETVGKLLDVSIDLLWTGPEIVSAEIPVDSIRQLTERIGRPPVIWDNLFANDYDLRRLYCGPYSGRSRELRDAVAGILVNPNNEFPINYVPLRTFASYLSGEGNWEPRDEFLTAATEWLESYATCDRPITLEDLILLADCYYLPHEDGPGASELREVVERLLNDPVESWKGAESSFAALNGRIQSVFESLTQLRDRELFYAWSRRALDFKEELQLIDGFLAKKKEGVDASGGIPVDTHLPETYRGGIVAGLQRLLTMDEQGNFQ